MYICSLLLGDSYPFPYILEVFQHQDVAWLQRFNDSLGHDMVDVAHPDETLALQINRGVLIEVLQHSDSGSASSLDAPEVLSSFLCWSHIARKMAYGSAQEIFCSDELKSNPSVTATLPNTSVSIEVSSKEMVDLLLGYVTWKPKTLRLTWGDTNFKEALIDPIATDCARHHVTSHGLSKRSPWLNNVVQLFQMLAISLGERHNDGSGALIQVSICSNEPHPVRRLFIPCVKKVSITL